MIGTKAYGKPVFNRDKSHERSGRPEKNRDHELKRGPTGRRSSNARQLGCGFSRCGAAEVAINLTEELRHAETDPMCSIH